MFGKSAVSKYTGEPEVIAGIDIGTSKISVITAEKEGSFEEPQITAVDYAQSIGISKGNIVNAERVAKAVKQAVSAVEGWVAQPIKKASVSFSCSEGMTCLTTSGKKILGVNARPVMQEDIERVIQLAKEDLAVPSSKTVIHTIPVEYSLDDNIIEDPLGMTGKVLKVVLLSVIIPVATLENIINCVKRAGVEIESLVIKPLASALAVVTPEEAQNGVVVLDIGGGTTSVTVYANGHPVYMGMIPIGGDHITNDIATVLKVPLINAEELKRKVVLGTAEEADNQLEFMCNGRSYYVSGNEVTDIINCRLEELCTELIIPKIKESAVQTLSGGVILTGGVSKMAGIDLLFRELFSLPVRIAAPSEKSAMPQGRNGQEFSAVAGIIKYITENQQNKYSYISSDAESTIAESDNQLQKMNVKNVINSDLKENTKALVTESFGQLGKLFKELF